MRVGLPEIEWSDFQQRMIAEAIESARAGTPTTLLVEGSPGTGKSTVIAEIISRLRADRILVAECRAASSDDPLSTLRMLMDPAELPADLAPFQASNLLRDAVEDASRASVVALILDDAQWADPVSISALRWLFLRSEADCFLLVLAARPSDRVDLDELVASGRARLRLATDGLSVEQVQRMIAGSYPNSDPGLARELHAYTGGNPLALRALLSERSPAEILHARSVPVPRAFAEAAVARVSALGERAKALLEAVAVLGPEPSPPGLCAKVADIVDDEELIADLLREGILVEASGGIRLQHDLLREAVYRAIEPRRRAQLHERAGSAGGTVIDRYRHRVAAVEGTDAALADELEGIARIAHLDGNELDAMRLLDWSSRLSPDPAAAEVRWLDARIEEHLGDLSVEPTSPSALDAAADRARAKLVRALQSMTANEWADALRVLESVTDTELRDSDALTRHRVHGYRASVGVYCGASKDFVEREMSRANATGVIDPRLAGYFGSSAAQTSLSTRRVGEPWLFEDLDSRERIPDAASVRLAIRGAGLLYDHRPYDALEALEEYRRRVAIGLVADRSGGTYLALLGLARWLSGDARLAAEAVRFAVDAHGVEKQHPGLIAVRAIAPLAEGDAILAAQYSRTAWRTLSLAPWGPAVSVHLIIDALRREIYGTDAERADMLSETIRAFGDPLAVARSGALLTGAYLARASLWAGDFATAKRLADALDAPEKSTPLGARVRSAVLARVAEQDGDLSAAASHYRTALARPMAQTPYLYARTLYELSRCSELLADAAGARHQRAEALQIYARLGLPAPAENHETLRSDPFAVLSPRERDIAELIVNGLSYEQVASRLFITTSTVSFHLSKIYAKTNTRRRHDLVELAGALSAV